MKPKSEQEKHVQNKGQGAFESLLSAFRDTQAGKTLALQGRKEEKVQPFFLFIILLKSV